VGATDERECRRGGERRLKIKMKLPGKREHTERAPVGPAAINSELPWRLPFFFLFFFPFFLWRRQPGWIYDLNARYSYSRKLVSAAVHSYMPHVYLYVGLCASHARGKYKNTTLKDGEKDDEAMVEWRRKTVVSVKGVKK